MNIKLNKISIRNFKGIKELDIAFDGHNVNIYGDNATGKTTIFDAFLWTLFGKNSAGKSDFEWKPLDPDGNEIHYLETSVELSLQIDGENKILKKCATENWVKKRGNIEQVFEGNNNNYWIDEVPTKATDFQKYIASIINEQKFKMITNPLFFNSQMTPDEQRTVVSSIAEIGNITDERIMSENKEFTLLCEKLNGRSIEDFLKIVNETIKKLNKEIENIPVRIDEVSRTLIVVDERELKSATDSISALEIQKNVINSKINDIFDRRKNNEELISQLTSKQQELEKLKITINDEINSKIHEEQSNIKSEISKLEYENNSIKLDIETLLNNIAAREKELEELRKRFDEENAVEFTDKNNYVCPVCKREYEKDVRESMLNEARNSFQEHKQNHLEEINNHGKSIVKIIHDMQDDRMHQETLLSENIKKLNELKEKLTSLHEYEVNYLDDVRFKKVFAEVDELNQKANLIKIENSSALEEQLKEIQEKIDNHKQVLIKKEAQTNAEERIEQLKQYEKELSIKIQEQEGLKSNIEEFTKTKVALLEEKINENFNLVKFKLFETQINGGVKEVCYATVDGVPYSDLNSAMKINAGLDVIKTLMKFYDVKAPVFIDNRETINNLVDIDTQIISLIVSHDSSMRIEVI